MPPGILPPTPHCPWCWQCPPPLGSNCPTPLAPQQTSSLQRASNCNSEGVDVPSADPEEHDYKKTPTKSLTNVNNESNSQKEGNAWRAGQRPSQPEKVRPLLSLVHLPNCILGAFSRETPSLVMVVVEFSVYKLAIEHCAPSSLSLSLSSLEEEGITPQDRGCEGD